MPAGSARQVSDRRQSGFPASSPADPFRKPPPFEKLLGDLRPIWPVIEIERVVKVLRMWTHYE